MGPIQQATNQLLQAGATAATVGKHFVNQGKRDTLSALETTESLSNEYREVSTESEKSNHALEVYKQKYEKADENLESAKKAVEDSNKNIESLKSNPHPKRDNGQFMSSKEKDSKIDELYEKHKLLEKDQGIADSALTKSMNDLSFVNNQTDKLRLRLEFLQKKKDLLRDMVPKNARKALDDSFKNQGEIGTLQGELEGLLLKKKSNYKGENK